jgi:hypothetical protein
MYLGLRVPEKPTGQVYWFIMSSVILVTYLMMSAAPPAHC